jgi:tetratricopeptide (TPR) repeat protein
LLDCLQWYFFIASSPQWKNDLYLASSSLNNLGFCFKPRKQNQEEAEMCFLGSWELIKTDPGKTDMQPRFLEDLAFFYRDWGKADTAEEIFRKLVEVRGTIACPKSDLARSLTDLSFVQDKMGKQKLAEENFARAISVLESDPNVDRRQLAQQIEYLAFFYKQHNRLSEAYPLFKRAASLRK